MDDKKITPGKQKFVVKLRAFPKKKQITEDNKSAESVIARRIEHYCQRQAEANASGNHNNSSNDMYDF